MTTPGKALIDGDILRYEVGFAAEAAIKAASGGKQLLPDWEWIENIFFERFNRICEETEVIDYTIFLSEGESFRFKVATTKPYKGQRVDNKPWHFNNLTEFIKAKFNCNISRPGLEADDEMAIAHVDDTTIVCSRDKDLRQLPGWTYSWELGKQRRQGPCHIKEPGYIQLTPNRKEVKGQGSLFFWSQMLTGDRADNIPGLEGCGPVKAYNLLKRANDECNLERAEYTVKEAFKERYGVKWWDKFEEQHKLLWLIRSEDGIPPEGDQ